MNNVKRSHTEISVHRHLTTAGISVYPLNTFSSLLWSREWIPKSNPGEKLGIKQDSIVRHYWELFQSVPEFQTCLQLLFGVFTKQTLPLFFYPYCIRRENVVPCSQSISSGRLFSSFMFCQLWIMEQSHFPKKHWYSIRILSIFFSVLSFNRTQIHYSTSETLKRTSYRK